MKMSLKKYLAKKDSRLQVLIKEEKTSKKEIDDLFAIVHRDIKSSEEASNLNLDWQFGIAYNAALKLCVIPIRASGVRVTGGPHHYISILCLPYYLGERFEKDAIYFNRCRRVRNRVEYHSVGGVSESDVKELIEFCKELLDSVNEWIYANHTELMK